MGLHPQDNKGWRRAPQEVFDLAVDETEMLLQAMDLLNIISQKDCLPKTWDRIRILKQAFEVWKQGD